MKRKMFDLLSFLMIILIICGIYKGIKTVVDIGAVKDQKIDSFEKKSSSKNSLVIPKNDIKSITMIIDKKEVTFIKNKHLWQILGEPEFPVNQLKITAAILGLENLKAYKLQSKNIVNSIVGYDNPTNRITIEQFNGNKTVLIIGKTSNESDITYLWNEKYKKDVYYADSRILNEFNQGIYYFAIRRDFHEISPSSIYKIDVKGLKDNYSLQREELNIWRMIYGNDNELADTNKANEILSDIKNFKYDKFINYKATDLTQYGFDDKKSISISYYVYPELDNKKDVDPILKNIDLEIGKEYDNASYYVTIKGSNQVYTMSKDILNPILNKNKSDFYSLIIYYVPIKDMKFIDVSYKDVVYNFSTYKDDNNKKKQSFYLNGKEIDKMKFMVFYNQLIALTAQKRVDTLPVNLNEVVMEFTLTDNMNNIIKENVYYYDDKFYEVVVNNKVFLVEKEQIDIILAALQKII